MAASSWLRIAVVQFAPKLGEVHANIAKARELCKKLTPRSVDLVCLPEMIFTGYIFPDAPSIAPYLEHPKTGPTASFCAELARRLECHVVAGFPERLASPTPTPTPGRSESTSESTTPTTPHALLPADTVAPPLIGANAALLVDTTGRPIHTYHKSNLFPTDLPWARPGPGFTFVDLPLPLGRTAVAICNDLNVDARAPGGWASIERGPYELAEFCRRAGVRVVLVLNAWLRPEDGGMEGVKEGGRRDRDQAGGDGGNGGDDGEEGEGGDDAPDEDGGLEPNWRVLNYWAMRLRPLWADVPDGTLSSETGAEPSCMVHADEQQEVIVVVCNRFGHDRGKTFAGSSAMFSMHPGFGKPRLLHVMGEREEGMCVWTVRIETCALSSPQLSS